MESCMESGMETSGHPEANWRRAVVGITSRSSDIFLTWLVNFLREQFPDLISEVRYLPISNANRSSWEMEVQLCTVGILYHTKHQGPINVTDEKGAMYNQELQYLHVTLGRENVLVVLDDLKRSDEEERQRILKSQPSLSRLAAQLVLIPENQKYEAASEKRSEFFTVLPKVLTLQHDHYYSSYKEPTPTYLRSIPSQVQKTQEDENHQACQIISTMNEIITSNPSTEMIPHPSNHQAYGIISTIPEITASNPSSEMIPHPSNHKACGIISTVREITASNPSTEMIPHLSNHKACGIISTVREITASNASTETIPHPSNHQTCMIVSTIHEITASNPSVSQYRIGIFSRSAESLYTWLIVGLQVKGGTELGDIKCVQITNDYRAFNEEVIKCQFAILYHSLKEGPIRITDVPDALYDEALKHLSDTLGKSNVIVVVDDMKSKSNKMKERILGHQPSISQYAGELFLFTDLQKRPHNVRKIVKMIQSNLQSSEISSPDSPIQTDAVFNVQEPDGDVTNIQVPSTTTSIIVSSRKSSSCRKDNVGEPAQKKIILEINGENLKETKLDDLSEKLNQNVAITKKVQEKVDHLQLTVQQMRQFMITQNGTQRNQEMAAIADTVKKMLQGVLLEKEKQSEKMNEVLMGQRLQEREVEIGKQKKELQEREEEIKKQKKELQEREEEIMKQTKELREQEEEIRKQKKELHDRVEESWKRERELHEREEEVRKQEEKFRDKDEELMKRERELQEKEEKMLLRELQCMAEKTVKSKTKSQETEERTEDTEQGETGARQEAKPTQDSAKTEKNKPQKREGQTSRTSPRKRPHSQQS